MKNPNTEKTRIQTSGEDQGNVVSINGIRTETAFSQYPIHQLSKQETHKIRIIRRDSTGGQIEFKWQVSPSEDFGHPRQLAYKLDKLIIDRKIDELRIEHGSVPRIFPLGNLRPIARELQLGGNTDALKEALRQSATASITAKVK